MERGTHRRTRHFNIMLVLLAAGAVVLAVAMLDPMAWASQDRDPGYGGRRGGHDLVAGVCADAFDGRIRGLTGYVDGWLELDGPQRAAWDRVETALGDGVTALSEACQGAPVTAAAPTVPERLARAEALMVAGTDAVRTLRPAFDAFYATLDEAQRLRLDEAAAHRRYRR